MEASQDVYSSMKDTVQTLLDNGESRASIEDLVDSIILEFESEEQFAAP